MGAGADGVALGPMHHGRRRREKKLMTMEEVETQFPQMSYKAWRAQRERMGLSTEGGVSAVCTEDAQVARDVLKRGSTTRPGSIRSVRTRRDSLHTIAQVDTSDSGIYEIGAAGHVHVDSKLRRSEDDILEKPTTASSGNQCKKNSIAIDREIDDTGDARSRTSIGSRRASVPAIAESPTDVEEAEAVETDEVEIQHLPEDIGSGDTCAICIDQLEEDDEVRGLSCGHAFHCACVDVWLTTRRAICPLCKRDYWVRKAPAPGVVGPDGLAEGADQSRTLSGAPLVTSRFAFLRAELFSRPNRLERPTPVRRTTSDLEAGRVPTSEATPVIT